MGLPSDNVRRVSVTAHDKKTRNEKSCSKACGNVNAILCFLKMCFWHCNDNFITGLESVPEVFAMEQRIENFRRIPHIPDEDWNARAYHAHEVSIGAGSAAGRGPASVPAPSPARRILCTDDDHRTTQHAEAPYSQMH